MKQRRWEWLREFIAVTKFSNECVEWRWSKSKAGYGNVYNPATGKNHLVHRAALEFFSNQEIPKGLHVCHRCDNPACFNPFHMFLGDDAANHADKLAKGRCPRGEDIKSSKLSRNQVFEIFALRSYMTSEEVGAVFGVNPRHIRLIWSGKNIWVREYEEYISAHPEYLALSSRDHALIVRRMRNVSTICCPNCQSRYLRKNGIRASKQLYKCLTCSRGFQLRS